MFRLAEHVSKLNGRKVLVVGDIMLDKYIAGDVTRVSPEAPVPVVSISSENYTPGGAGNTAKNVTSLGGEAYLVGVVGADASKDILLKQLHHEGVRTEHIAIDASRPTTEKIRILGNNQQLLRMDSEKVHEIRHEVEDLIVASIETLVGKVDVIVVSDYNKGVISGRVMDKLKECAERYQKRIVVDPKPAHKELYKGLYVITPNIHEAHEMSGMHGMADSDIERIGAALRNSLAANVLITRGDRGMTLCTESGCLHVLTEAREVYDVSGAGDTVAATLGLGIAAGLSLHEAATLANYAAGVKVGKRGTATVTPDELKSVLRWEISAYLEESIDVKRAVIEKQLDKIEAITKLIIETYKNGNKILVFGNGGSASDAQHFVGELVGRFKVDRAGLPALSLNSDTTILTAVSNDFGYETVFERQVGALANKGDLVIGITTSGNSENVVRAIEKGKAMGLKTVSLTGKDGGRVAKLADISVIVPSDNTPRIQEAHIAIIHIICELLERNLFLK
ncbi:MAG: D-glycero-beta-D-manno-heptose-7-phosphate kinase [Candidatus Aenigmarchaeota archaeon]|nr:D-glycero-beta-D-manno-heptose-7-phosphate kinase [Candidatus Aenigmarchaeota archaeon]